MAKKRMFARLTQKKDIKHNSQSQRHRNSVPSLSKRALRSVPFNIDARAEGRDNERSVTPSPQRTVTMSQNASQVCGHRPSRKACLRRRTLLARCHRHPPRQLLSFLQYSACRYSAGPIIRRWPPTLLHRLNHLHPVQMDPRNPSHLAREGARPHRRAP